MNWDDLRKLVLGTTLYRLNGLIGVRLVPVLYALGLAGIGLWAIDHLFFAFSFNFGQGLWGILETLVYGPLLLIALRIAAELVLVLFRANAEAAAAVDSRQISSNLLDDVNDAIRELAEDDDDDGIIPATDPAPYTGSNPAAAFDPIDPQIKDTLPGRKPAAKT